MAKTGYAIQNFDEKKMAKARINNAEVSRKISIEICNMIRNRSTIVAKKMLEDVVDFKAAVPYRKFNRDVAHKKVTGPGRYPIKAVKSMIQLIKLAEANAANKGLSSELIITHLAANKGMGQWHYGRKRRTEMKSTHLEIAVTEKEAAKKAHSEKKEKNAEKSEAAKPKKTAPKKTTKKSEA